MPRRHSTNSRAFTLAELLVAVSVVIVLSVAIGQVFTQVGRLVRTGSAVSELDQAARAIEKQFRDDFASLSRMNPDETFLAIRSRTLGDANSDGVITAARGEKTLYATQEDKEADIRDGYTPYQRDSSGRQIGRAVTRRIDEIVFLARASEKAKFMSYQQAGAEDQPVTSDYARIYIGHGLKPGPARTPAGGTFDPTRAMDAENRPIRRLYPDARLAVSPSPVPTQDAIDPALQESLEWGSVFAEPLTRNEFASEFTLLRQAMLLVGGRAAGGAPNPGSTRWSSIIPVPPTGDQNPNNTPIPNLLPSLPWRTYAPLIRDREIYFRNNWGSAAAGTRFSLGDGWGYPGFTFAAPRLIRWGRTDICAQDRDDVQRWLEGLATSSTYLNQDASFTPADATAYMTGTLDNFADDGVGSLDWQLPPNVNQTADAPLMNRVVPQWGTSGADLTNAQAINYATTMLRSAIAGVFTRILCEPGAQVTSRALCVALPDRVTGITNTPDPFPADAAMDQHAVIAARCSNFEVAWSDGTRWANPRPLKVYRGPSATEPYLYAQFNNGDTIWFDSVFTRRQYRTLNIPGINAGVSSDPNLAQPDPEVLPNQSDATFFASTDINSVPPISQQDRTNISTIQSLTSSATKLLIRPGSQGPAPAYNAAYDPEGSGGNTQEYMAIFGFRRPVIVASGSGRAMGWSDIPWEKPKLIRIRMTIHDSANRVPGGKSYEFVFAINLGVQ